MFKYLYLRAVNLETNVMGKNNYVVIMAGGIGSRFWPMSKSSYPKQFHDVLGIGQSLLQLTVERYKKICPIENIFIVTNKEYKHLVQEQIPDLSENQIVLEPCRKNTAPCIAYATYKIYELNKKATIIVAPSDHLILKERAFEQTIEIAIEQVKKENCLLTIGIKPTRPDTGYGYIQFETVSEGVIHESVKKVKTFTEKPSIDIAKQFIDSGDFYWNSGMFVWTAKDVLKAFNDYLPEVDALFAEGLGKYNTKEEMGFIEDMYPICKNISIDYGVMEKASNVCVILADLGWSDLGTWGSLYTHVKKDESKNAVIGKQVFLYDSKSNIVKIEEGNLAVIQGLTDYIVVQTDNTLLICKKQDEQKIKQFVQDIKAKKLEQFV